MRYFNTSGPCYPDEHYTIMREDLVNEGLKKIEQGRYFTIFSPRQAGKTTYFQLLISALKKRKGYAPLWISVEPYFNLSPKEFYESLEYDFYLCLKGKRKKNTISKLLKNLSIKKAGDLLGLFTKLKDELNKKLVLIIDEFDGVPESVLPELMHTFRKMYHLREYRPLHSLILVGVSFIPGVVISHASPFNVTDEIRVPYFTSDEVHNLIDQYTQESGQKFEEEVISAIYSNTQGQPGLVNALCAHLVEKVCTDRSKPVSIDGFYKTLNYFLIERYDKNISNIVNKAMMEREFMLKVLFEEEVPFTVDDRRISFLNTNGVIENKDGFVDIPVPLYKKRLINSFKPLLNGENSYYITSVKDNFSKYLLQEGIDLKGIIEKYISYVRRRGFRAFDTENLKEGACHYSLDGFINFVIEGLNGQTFVETPTGRGRTDILILCNNRKYIIETKIYKDETRLEKGKKQLVEYLKSEGLNEGYYVVFSSMHTDSDQLYFEDEIDGKKIYTFIVRTNFEQPTQITNNQ